MPAPVKTVADLLVFTGADSVAETDPYIAGQPNGNFTIGWADDSGSANPERSYVNYAAAGTQQGNVRNLSAAIDESDLSGAFSSQGYQMRVWTETADAGGDKSIHAQTFSPTTGAGFGTVSLNTNFLVNTGRDTGAQFRPEVTPLADGKFLIAWVNGGTSRIDAAIYDVAGNALVAPFELGVSATNQSFRIDATTLQNGNAVISYRTDSFDAKFRIVGPSGNIVGAEFDFDGVAGNTGATGVAALADGRFAYVATGTGGILGRIFNADGTAATAVFNVLTSGDLPVIVGLLDGRFMVAAPSNGEIVAQMMNADGTKDGAEFTVNTVTTGTQTNVALSLTGDGRIAVAWQTSEAGNADIKTAVYDPRETGVTIAGTGSQDDYIGSGFGDFIVTGDGNDKVDGGAGGDLLFGASGNDTLNGGDGNDSLEGGAGNDTLNGDNDDDFMSGGLGADALNGGAGINIAVYRGQVTVNLTSPAANTGEAAGDTLSNIQGIVGSDLNDTLVGDGSNNFLFGQGGVDTLIGGAGADVLNGGEGGDFLVGGDGGDIYDGGNGYDVVSYSDAPTGVVIDMATPAAGTGFAAGDSFTGIEQINLNDFGNNASGDANANTLVGGAGADVLNGRDGNDFLFGGGGDDVIFGGLGADLMNGEGGTNTAAYGFAAAGVTADLQFGSAAGTGEAAGDSFFNITGLVGTGFADDLRGDTLGNILQGGVGDDLIFGRDGNDLLIGGAGNDFMAGGTNNDTFRYAAGDGADTITDFTAGVGVGDVLQISTVLVAANFAAVMATAFQSGGNTVFNFGGGQTITVLGVAPTAFVADDFSFF